MKTELLALFSVLSFVASIPQSPDKDATVIQYNLENKDDGGYSWNYETSNSIKAQEIGSPEPADAPEDGNVIVKEGSYSFKTPEGVVVEITYKADKQGFVAQGDSIPTPPPIPAAIQRALDYIASQPSTTEGRGKR